MSNHTQNHAPDMDNKIQIEQKSIIELNTHFAGLSNDRVVFIALRPYSCLHLITEH